jgi:hypothetical protein
MALEMTLDTLEGMDENISKLYIEKDGKFHLDVSGDDKSRIPVARLNQEIEKRKTAEKAVEAIATNLIEALPEEFQDLVPNLSPAEKIKWIRAAEMKGLFHKTVDGLDLKKPGDKKPADFSGLSPQAIMAQGYGKKKG